jgi:hypothetical protein
MGNLAWNCNLDGSNFPKSSLRHPDFPGKKFSKIDIFWPRKPTTQKPRSHQQITTTSPQKTIKKHCGKPKTPSKNAPPTKQGKNS